MRRRRPPTALAARRRRGCAFRAAGARGDAALDTGYTSHALGGRLHYEVYLPPDYDSSGLRYPVVYFLHGLPASGTLYRSVRFVERALDTVRAGTRSSSSRRRPAPASPTRST